MRVPSGFSSRRLDSTDSIAYEVTNGATKFTVDYGLPASEGAEAGESSVQLDGGNVLMRSEANEILVRWPTLGPYRTLAVSAEFSNETDRNLVCRILSSIQLLGSVDQLTVLKIQSKGPKRSATMRVREKYQHTFNEGDYATLSFGKIQTIDDTFVEIVEIMPNGEGGWKDQVTRLKPLTNK